MPVANLQKLDYWEHTKPEILKQGRITFFDGNVLYQNSEEEEKSEASDEESEEPVKKIETPIPLFASCSGDRLVYERMSPWSIRLCDFDQKIVFVQSHNWPGAFALAKER